MQQKKLFLLDAYALIYRAYYALIRSPRLTSKGFNTSAIFGFVNTLDEILRKEDPQYIAVCFDPPGGHTFRHDMYPDYKAQRDKQPEDITMAVPLIKEILEAYRIRTIEVDGYEADDVIGTLSRMADAEGFVTYMMTPDKDYGQLVTPSVFMYRPALKGQGFEVRGPQQVCERYGIADPVQVIDLLALEGDASDNVPGCPGVGEKTASKLIAQWGSVENLIANISSLKGAMRTKIEDNAEQILFSKQLVTIRTDVPLHIDIESLRRRDIDTAALKAIYNKLEFRTFLARLDAREAAAATAAPVAPGEAPSLFDRIDTPAADASESILKPSIDDRSVSYTQAIDEADADRAVALACAAPRAAVALQAIGDEAMTARWLAIAIATEPGKATCIPVHSADRSRLQSLLTPLFTSAATTVTSNDIKRDMLLLRRAGIPFTAPYFDTSVGHYLLQPESKHDIASMALSMLSYRTLDYGMTPAERRKAAAATGADAVRALCEQADMALRLAPVISDRLAAEGLTHLMTDIELPFVAVLADMEWQGVRIDTAELARQSVKLTSRLDALEREVYNLAGQQFNIASPGQVGDILFDKLAIDPKAKKTKRGAWSTTEEILEKYRRAHPIVGLILEIRGLRKLLATYIDALPRLINPATGKIHTTYNQTVTATGRISSTNPNLQNIPIRTDEGREIRRAFIPDNGCQMMSADYSQIELRLIADISGDPHMIEAFNRGEDIHRATAAKVFHTPLDRVTDFQRRAAKTANFGIIYGISAFGLSERLGMPRAEAKALIDGYFESYPDIRRYMDASIAGARDNGYVSTICGRKRYLPEINSRNAVVRGYAERNAINAPLQGSAADIIKIAMIRIARALDEAGMKSRMIMQVHDELVFNVAPGELERLTETVTSLMEHAYSGKVRLTVSAGTGANWLEAH